MYITAYSFFIRKDFYKVNKFFLLLIAARQRRDWILSMDHGCEDLTGVTVTVICDVVTWNSDSFNLCDKLLFSIDFFSQFIWRLLGRSLGLLTSDSDSSSDLTWRFVFICPALQVAVGIRP